MYLPQDEKRFTNKVLEVLEQCRTSCDLRAGYARQYKLWRETGSPDGVAAIFNRLDYHIGRVAGFLYSPSGLRFAFEYENRYPQDVYKQSEAAGVALTKRYTKPRRANTDTPAALFKLGLAESLTYGAAVVKTLQEHDGATQRLVMPWQMGVFREDLLGFAAQEAVSETNFITKYDFWRRISTKPAAMELYKRATSNAQKRSAVSDMGGLNQIVLTGTSPAVLTEAPYTAQAGGVMNSGGSLPAVMSPEVADDLIEIHELWIRDDVTGDWTTVQIAEPNIILTSKLRRQNLFVPNRLPYTLIQPNQANGYFWGKTEMQQLFKLQWLLRDRAEDIKKILALQYDRLLGITNSSAMLPETYDQMRQSGYISLDAGGQITDLTPQLPENAWAEFENYFKLFDDLSGFKPIMTGEGDAGVRSGNQAQTLLKTASPQMRDKALLVEHQVAAAAQNLFECMAVKEDQTYWVDPADEETTFLLNQLPEDRTVAVDSHSSSPIYEDEHMQLAAFALKGGVIDGEQFIDMVNGFPQPELAKDKLRAREAAKQAQIRQLAMTDPQGAMKLIQGGKK